MAKASSYIYKGTLHTMKQLAEAFGVSYARMSFLMKANGMQKRLKLFVDLAKWPKAKRQLRLTAAPANNSRSERSWK